MIELVDLFTGAGSWRWILAAGGLVGGLGAIGAALLVAARPRTAWRLAVFATFVGSLTAVAGAGVTVAARSATDVAVRGLDAAVERTRTRRDGYIAAQPFVRLGLAAGALPIATGVLLTFLARRRMPKSRTDDGEEAPTPRPLLGPSVIASTGAALACCVSVAALLEPVPGRNQRADATTRLMLDLVDDVRAATETDRLLGACGALERSLEERRGTLDRGAITGLAEGRRACVEAAIQSAAVRRSIADVKDRLEALSRSPLVERDPTLADLVARAREEVRDMTQPVPEPVSMAPRVHVATLTLAGGLPSDVAGRVVRQHTGRYRLCFENGLRTTPTLAGRIVLRATVGEDGVTRAPVEATSTVPNAGVIACMREHTREIGFPASTGGPATVEITLDVGPYAPLETTGEDVR